MPARVVLFSAALLASALGGCVSYGYAPYDAYYDDERTQRATYREPPSRTTYRPSRQHSANAEARRKRKTAAGTVPGKRPGSASAARGVKRAAEPARAYRQERQSNSTAHANDRIASPERGTAEKVEPAASAAVAKPSPRASPATPRQSVAAVSRPATAAKPAAPAAAPTAAAEAAAPTAAEEAAARRQVDEGYRLLKAGFVKKARERFDAAMQAAPAEASLARARALDPTYLKGIAFPDAAADAEEARKLYRRAIMLGNAEAMKDLERLDRASALPAAPDVSAPPPPR